MNPKFMNRDDTFIIAEIGGNHEGDFDYAKKLLLDAAKSGADAVKFQIYKADKIVSRLEGEARNKHFKKFEMTDEQFVELAKLAEKNNIMFMASLWDNNAVNNFDNYLKIHKIGSGDLTNYPILEAIAKKNRPMIISTAMATLEEIKETVKFIEKVNPALLKENKLCMLHCVATYGDPKDEYANLLSIRKLQDEFPNIPIGYSDHTKGVYPCELAITMGARVIEKHFTDDKTREFRDHHISADLDDMKELVEKAEKIKTLLGKYEKKPIEEVETLQRINEFRRAVYLKEDLKAGDILTKDNLITLRPNVGVDARDYYKILGKRLKKDKKAYEAIYPKDLTE